MTQATRVSHTPGPWTAWDDDGTGTLPCVLAQQVTSYGNFYVAQCNVFADARLIAAAPALLEAAETVLARCDHTNIHTTLEDMRDTWELLRTAIRQATGKETP